MNKLNTPQKCSHIFLNFTGAEFGYGSVSSFKKADSAPLLSSLARHQ